LQSCHRFLEFSVKGISKLAESTFGRVRGVVDEDESNVFCAPNSGSCAGAGWGERDYESESDESLVDTVSLSNEAGARS
jgi:hypothetical protein